MTLFGGDVVYFTRKGWSPDRAEAFVATDEAGAEALEASLEEARRRARWSTPI